MPRSAAYEPLPTYRSEQLVPRGRAPRPRLALRLLAITFVFVFGTWTIWTSPWTSRWEGLHNLVYPSAKPTGPYVPGAFQPPVPLLYEDDPEPETWPRKAQRVRQAFQHAYRGYERWASGFDELLPISNRSKNNFNGWGVTLFDSLDTMLLMGLRGEFERAMAVVESADFYMKDGYKAPFFETVIRYLGGLLSAYALSGEPVLLEKADLLGTGLSPAFSNNSGFPEYSVNPTTGISAKGWTGLLAEIASCQVEYTYLAKATGKKEHWDSANRIIRTLASANLTDMAGMLPSHWNMVTGQPTSMSLSVGAGADSAHEYLLKQYLLTGRTDKINLEMYLRMTTHVLTNLTYLSPTRQLLYVTDQYSPFSQPSHHQEHLSCFFPGLLALGAHTLPLDDLPSVGINFTALGDGLTPADQASYALLSRYNLKQLHLWAAEGIAQSCWLAYADQRSGLAPDEIQFSQPWIPIPEYADTEGVYTGHRRNPKWMEALQEWSGGMGEGRGLAPGTQDVEPVVYDADEAWMRPPRPKDKDRDYVNMRNEFFLRPETVESLYILYRTTGDPKWRERGWQIFRSIETHARTASGYASIKIVDSDEPWTQDDMPSFFLAETLKYLYLLFMDEDVMPLDRWVFNTEAHPLPVFEWTQREMEELGLGVF